jgi:16S rRNA (guanine527-N7)-methyltransferase
LEILGRPLTDPETDRLAKYLNLLIKWQRVQRLVGSSEPDWIVDHIVLDSLLYIKLVPASAERILDVGSGAGVPGVPLKIVLDDAFVTLLEARSKRASFLSAVVRELDLARCEVLNARLETIAQERQAQYDAVVMRCAGDPAAMKDAAMRLIRPGGVIVASGPPKPRSSGGGDRVELISPIGRRSFWTARQT